MSKNIGPYKSATTEMLKNSVKPKVKLPKKGDKIYVGSAYYIDRGEDDFDGGICTIKSVRRDDAGHIFVAVKERPGTETNYEYLLEHQDKWKKEYGDRKGKMNPDFG